MKQTSNDHNKKSSEGVNITLQRNKKLIIQKKDIKKKPSKKKERILKF